MAHEMPAAAGGFLWPSLVFEYDGVAIKVTSQPGAQTSKEPVRYIDDFSVFLSVSDFERSIDLFMETVLDRLESAKITNTELHAIWAEVRQERSDPAESVYRKLEAALGYEPDEAPEDTVARLRRLSSEAGEHAIDELAYACSGADADQRLAGIVEQARSTGIAGNIRLEPRTSITDASMMPPWKLGRDLADAVRHQVKVGGGPLSDKLLSGLIGAEPTAFEKSSPSEPQLRSIGLTVRSQASDRLTFHFRRQNRTSRRFEAARFIADYLTAPDTDYWLPATNSKSYRQKFQRAFAAQFLCPVGDLLDFLSGDFTDEGFDAAGERYGVSPNMVSTHLINNNILPYDSQ
jgi:hypothetical protein